MRYKFQPQLIKINTSISNFQFQIIIHNSNSKFKSVYKTKSGVNNCIITIQLFGYTALNCTLSDSNKSWNKVK
jgi:hypothetical protein